MIWRQFFVKFLLILSINLSKSEHRTKRFLTFPRTSPTRLQMIVGFGIPVELEIESVTIGWVSKSEFFLPENATNFLSFLNDPYDLTTRPITGFYVRKRRGELLEEQKPTDNPAKISSYQSFDNISNEKFERSEVNAEVIESGKETEIDDVVEDEFEHENEEEYDVEHGDEDNVEHDVEHDDEHDVEHDDEHINEMSEAEYWNQEDRAEWMEKLHPKQPKKLNLVRWGVYNSIALLAQNFFDLQGLDGKSCVLRGICESAHTSFDYSNGILGELMHILMTPSLTSDEIVDHSDYEYFHAEKLGRDGAPCEHIFKECKVSILDQFSGIYTPILDMFRKMPV